VINAASHLQPTQVPVPRHIFVTGGVVSSLGKGLTAASLGRLLRARGISVVMQKLDPYINVDPGTMSPFQHGEVFVTDDGSETDLDIGHYERFLDENLDQSANVTTGQVYSSVIAKERRGEYLGDTVQVIPHITNEIQAFVERGAGVGTPAEAEAGALEMGPLIEERAVKAVAEKVERAVKQGATLVCGGKRAEGRGYFFEPTLLTDTDNNMDIMKEETFGPVLPVSTFDTLDQVIALANDCEFGLTSSVYTTNLNEAFYVTRRLQFGETYINRENFEAMQGFHAGWKKSGIGGADGKHGLEEYLQTQVVYLETNI